MHKDGHYIRLINKEDYEEIAPWFHGHGWQQEPRWEYLPSTGYVCEYKGQMQAVGWLYLTNSLMGVLEYTATNPQAPTIQRVKSLKFLVNFIKGQAMDLGVRSIIQFIGPDSLAKYYQKHLGFILTDKATLAVYNIKGDE